MPAVWTNVDSATDDETVHFQSGEFGLAALRGDPRDLPGIIVAALGKNVVPLSLVHATFPVPTCVEDRFPAGIYSSR